MPTGLYEPITRFALPATFSLICCCNGFHEEPSLRLALQDQILKDFPSLLKAPPWLELALTMCNQKSFQQG